MPDNQVKIKKSSESMNVACCSDGDYYPYGTSINVEDDLVDELGVSALDVGDVVEVRGYAFVDGKSEHSSKEHSSKSIRLQLTSLKVDRESDDRVKALYGDQ